MGHNFSKDLADPAFKELNKQLNKLIQKYRNGIKRMTVESKKLRAFEETLRQIESQKPWPTSTTSNNLINRHINQVKRIQTALQGPLPQEYKGLKTLANDIRRSLDSENDSRKKRKQGSVGNARRASHHNAQNQAVTRQEQPAQPGS